MSFIRTLTQENLICCGIGHTGLLFSKPSTYIHSYTSAAWLSGYAYNMQDPLQGHLGQLETWDLPLPYDSPSVSIYTLWHALKSVLLIF